ncbi:hypothetical protein IG616_15080 [Labrenzia suaedae]|uniref:Anti-sigma factor NepR domain-containing protein n=2 Tax=Roseibium litorale TaxID=2803841 RepID=A0ABR9CPS6_9HYPH|nr:hypothetical protein [Roseibium litorale]
MEMKEETSAGMLGRSKGGAADTVSEKLREYYVSIQNDGIPEKFLDLLEKLDEAEKAAQK